MKLLVSQTPVVAGGVSDVPDVPAVGVVGVIIGVLPDVPALETSPPGSAGFDPLVPLAPELELLVPLDPVVAAPVPAFGEAGVLLPAVPVAVLGPAVVGVIAAGV